MTSTGGTLGTGGSSGPASACTATCTGCTQCDAATRACVPQTGWCQISGSCVQVGTASPTNACMICDAQSPTAWSPAPSGTACSKFDSCFVSFACDAAGTCQGDVPVAPAAPVPARPISGTRTGSPWAPQERNTLRPLFIWGALVSSCPKVTYDLQVDDSCDPSSSCCAISTVACCRPALDPRTFQGWVMRSRSVRLRGPCALD
jgi:hypothetical protein